MRGNSCCGRGVRKLSRTAHSLAELLCVAGKFLEVEPTVAWRPAHCVTNYTCFVLMRGNSCCGRGVRKLSRATQPTARSQESRSLGNVHLSKDVSRA